jgi:hypothetical protein
MDDLRRLLKAEGSRFSPVEDEALRRIRGRHRRRELTRRGGLVVVALAIAGIGPFLLYREIAGQPGVRAGRTPSSSVTSGGPLHSPAPSEAPSPTPSASAVPSAKRPHVNSKAEFLLGPGGLGTAPFGADADEVIRVLSDKLGAPTFDTGWKGPICFVPEGRIVVWGSLATFFRRDQGSAQLVGYRYGGRLYSGMTYDNFDLGLSGGPDLATPEGIRVGSPDAAVRAAYPSAQYVRPDPNAYRFAPEYWLDAVPTSAIPETLIMDRVYPRGRVIQVIAGDTLDCGGE